MSYPPLALSLSHKLVLLEAKRSPKKRPKPINDIFFVEKISIANCG